MPTATNHTYLVTGHPAPSKKGNDDYFVSLTNLDGTKAVNPVTKKPLYVAVAPIDIALIGKVYSEGRLVKKAKNFDWVNNVGTRFLPDQTIDDFDLPSHDDSSDVDDQDPPMSWTTVPPLPDVKPIDADIQAAVNRISVDAKKVMALKPLFPHLDEYTLLKLVLADNMSQDRKHF